MYLSLHGLKSNDFKLTFYAKSYPTPLLANHYKQIIISIPLRIGKVNMFEHYILFYLLNNSIQLIFNQDKVMDCSFKMLHS